MAATTPKDGASAGAEGAAGGGAPQLDAPVRGSGATGLDALLTEAALGPGRSWWPGRSALKLVGRLALRPDVPVRRGLGLATEIARVTAGRSKVAPAKGDRRFRDPAWQGNPAFRRLMQGYLAVGDAVDRLLDEADLDWRTERRLRFAASLTPARPGTQRRTGPSAASVRISSSPLPGISRPPTRAPGSPA